MPGTPSSQPATGRHYLVVRPLAAHPRAFEDRVEELAAATGLEPFTLRQKLSGTALEILASGADPDGLAATAAALTRRGVAACVVAKAAVARGPRAVRCTRIGFFPDALEFFTRNGERAGTLRRGDPCLAVVGAADLRRLRDKLAARQAARRGPGLALEETLRLIYRNDPVLDLYLPGREAPLRVHGRRFDFTCLGERNTLAVGSNFPLVLDDVRDRAGALVLDTGFGQRQYPFLTWPDPFDAEVLLAQFDRYSRFVRRAWEAGLFGPADGGTSPSPLTPLAPLAAAVDPTGILWTAAPMLDPGAGNESGEATTAPAAAAEPPSLPPPPPGSVSAVTTQDPRSWAGVVARGARAYRHWVRALGAAPLMQPLLWGAAASFAAAVALDRPHPHAVGGMLFGAASCIHAFVLLRRKRAIADCPTARLRSLPMGEVETTGRAAAKYHLRAPFTQTECVYYAYQVFVRARHGDREGYTLREVGDSGRVPFYLEEDGHRVLVEPARAVLSAGTADTLLGTGADLLHLGLGRPVPADGKVVERVVPVGQKLYVMGFARRLHRSEHDRRQLLQQKLREVKSDPARMARFDRDGDGRIDAEEWEAARRTVEEEALVAALDEGAGRDEVAIGEHPAGGLFYISDRREGEILTSLAWRAPLAFAVGVAAIVGSGYALTRLLG